jgi:hypothetical protein
MSPETLAQLFVTVLRQMTDDERRAVASQLTQTLAERKCNQVRLLRGYRETWYATLSDRAAAVQIFRDIAVLESAGFRHRAAPAFGDAKRAHAFELLVSGSTLSSERIRKIIAGSQSQFR